MLATQKEIIPDGEHGLERLLLDYLYLAVPESLPGVNAFTTSDVLQQYSFLAARGVVPGRGNLLQLYPKLARDLEAFFEPISR